MRRLAEGLAILAIAAMATCGCGSRPFDTSPDPSQAVTPDPAAGPTAFLSAVEIHDFCGAIGGCEYEGTLTGPEGDQTWVYAPDAWPVFVAPADAPATLAPGTYTLTVAGFFMSDACTESGCPREGRAMGCKSDFAVRPGDVEARVIVAAGSGTCSIENQVGPQSTMCRAEDLGASIGRIDRTLGVSVAAVVVANGGDAECDLGGPVVLELTAANENDGPLTGWNDVPAAIHLEPGGSAVLTVRTASWGPGSWIPPVGLAILLPGFGGLIEAGPPAGSDGTELIPLVVGSGPTQVLEVVRGWDRG